MICIYPVIIPLFYAWQLRQKRTEETRFLREPYKRQWYHWEVVECGRRLLLTSTMVLLPANTSVQPAVACVLAALAGSALAFCEHHKDAVDTYNYLGGRALVFLSVYIALLLKLDIGTETSQSQRNFSMVMVALHVLMLVVAVGSVVLVNFRRSSPSEGIEPNRAQAQMGGGVVLKCFRLTSAA